LIHIFKRIDLSRDIHFHTKTTIDTLDYSGTSLNSGSKLVLAAHGEVKRELCANVPDIFSRQNEIKNAKWVMPGVIAITGNAFVNYEIAQKEMGLLNEQLKGEELQDVVLIVICDDGNFVAANMRNFLWTSFTKCNPSHDIYGINSFTEYKHWGCKGPLVLDARKKPHHAPVVEINPETTKNINRIFESGSLRHLK
jgi:4-hydroxy-3-polyprenylbenzoate decarboxylase